MKTNFQFINSLYKIRRDINLKNFILTSFVLFFSLSMIYMALFFFMPRIYVSYKEKFLVDKSVEIVEQITKNDLSYKEAVDVLRTFSQENGISLTLFFRSTPVYIASANLKFTSVISSLDGEDDIRETIDNSHEYYKTNFLIKDQNYTAYFSTSIQQISEIRAGLISLLPYIMTIISITSFIVSYIYFRLVTKPLIELNKVAKKMAMLDFRTKANIKRQDELGELGTSLNTLSTNLKKSMEGFKNDIEKEKLRDEQRISFIATMSHELKSPITAIKGQLEGMINNIGVYQNRDKYLKRSLAIAEDLDRLVREILVVSKLDTVDFNFNKEKFNLSPILEEIIKNLDYIQIDKKIKTVKKIEKNLFIEGDISLLKKAFKNIIENGMKYCPENGLFIVEAIKLKDRILIEIFNDGDSILEEDLNDEKIFEAFYRTEKSRNRETGGSGLGLHIVKKILKSHKFSYKIDNRDNGVVFTVEIPIPEKNLEITK